MELQLARCYYTQGTNGTLLIDGRFICHTIELPWKHNERMVSCIPAGTYAMVKRYSPKFSWHLHLTDVPGRELILLHPANNALAELKGCIAPVSVLTGPGLGTMSRPAFQTLMQLLHTAFSIGELVSLRIIPPMVAG